MICVDKRRGLGRTEIEFIVLRNHHQVLRILPNRPGGGIIARATHITMVVATETIRTIAPQPFRVAKAHQILHHSASGIQQRVIIVVPNVSRPNRTRTSRGRRTLRKSVATNAAAPTTTSSSSSTRAIHSISIVTINPSASIA